jgi:hypothetical protein
MSTCILCNPTDKRSSLSAAARLQMRIVEEQVATLPGQHAAPAAPAAEMRPVSLVKYVAQRPQKHAKAPDAILRARAAVLVEERAPRAKIVV